MGCRSVQIGGSALLYAAFEPLGRDGVEAGRFVCSVPEPPTRALRSLFDRNRESIRRAGGK